jgi:magnesium transporter
MADAVGTQTETILIRAMVVALPLAITAVVATLVASVLPLGLARLGADPALASGPVATVLQDILSVAIYPSIATMVLHWYP